MKTKEYIQKYNLSAGWNKECQKGFISDITQEFLAYLELCKAQDSIKGFENALNHIRTKWDAISNKVPYGIPENFWKYFYATVVVQLREQYCPQEMQRRRDEAEQRRKEREERRAYNERMQNEFREMFRQAEEERQIRFRMFLAMTLLLTEIPVESYKYLNLDLKATTDEINKRYRELAVSAHPDHGGSQEKFIELTEHKNKCLAWASR